MHFTRFTNTLIILLCNLCYHTNSAASENNSDWFNEDHHVFVMSFDTYENGGESSPVRIPAKACKVPRTALDVFDHNHLGSSSFDLTVATDLNLTIQEEPESPICAGPKVLSDSVTHSSTPIKNNPSLPILEDHCTSLLHNYNESQDKWFHLIRKVEQSFDRIMPSSQSQSRPLMGTAFFSLNANKRSHPKDIQNSLISALIRNDEAATRDAIENGAKFLSFGSKIPHAATVNYIPLELAIVWRKTSALKGMLLVLTDNETIFENYSADMKALFEYLLIRSVQYNNQEAVVLLMETFHVPILSNSFIIQQAIISHTSLDLFKYLFYKTSSTSYTTPYGLYADPPLHLAVRFNNHIIFNFLFKKHKIVKNAENKDGESDIFLVIKLKKYNFITKLFALNTDLMTRWTDKNGYTLLDLAIQHDQPDLLQILLKSCNFLQVLKDPNQLAVSFQLACKYGNREIISHFIKGDFCEDVCDELILNLRLIDNINIKVSESFFDFIISEYLKKIGSRTLCPASDFSFIDKSILKLALHYISANQLRFVNILLKHFPFLQQFSLNLPLSCFDSFILALIQDDLEFILEYLLKVRWLHADHFINGGSLLHIAVYFNRLNLVKLFISHCALIDVLDSNCRTALEIAVIDSKADIIKYLCSFESWMITLETTFDFFLAIFLNGASFSPLTINPIRFESCQHVLELFATFFTQAASSIPTTISDSLFRDIAIMSVHLELFLFYHVNRPTMTFEIFNVLKHLKEIRIQLNSTIQRLRIDSQRTHKSTQSFQIIDGLLTSFSGPVHQTISQFIVLPKAHTIQSKDLKQILFTGDEKLAIEYEFMFMFIK